jgi:acyl carrier protein
VIGAAEDLWDLRLLDSFAVVNLVFKLEEAFDIVFDFPDMNAKNFQSIHSILQLLEQKYGLSISSGK